MVPVPIRAVETPAKSFNFKIQYWKTRRTERTLTWKGWVCLISHCWALYKFEQKFLSKSKDACTKLFVKELVSMSLQPFMKFYLGKCRSQVSKLHFLPIEKAPRNQNTLWVSTWLTLLVAKMVLCASQPGWKQHVVLYTENLCLKKHWGAMILSYWSNFVFLQDSI